ncbi:MAG: phosphohistidine phosphatase SixA [Longimicrobiales bacterium]|nr:phosphohistidine phosphatase SixA [Longimicrobiales bacterium]
MQLYLIQHGKAKSKDEDPDRPLTEEGRREVETVMLLMMQYGAITAPEVLHSGKRRAAETAEIVGRKLDASVEEADGLQPMDDPGVWEERLIDREQDVVLVGHLPHLPKLASLLLSGDEEAELVEFTNGGVVCLRRDDEGRWALRWSIPPSLVA